MNLESYTTHLGCYVVSYRAELMPGVFIEHVALYGGRFESEEPIEKPTEKQ